MAAKEAFGIERAYGNIYFATGGFSNQADYLTFTENQDVADHTLELAKEYSTFAAQIIEAEVY